MPSAVLSLWPVEISATQYIVTFKKLGSGCVHVKKLSFIGLFQFKVFFDMKHIFNIPN